MFYSTTSCFVCLLTYLLTYLLADFLAPGVEIRPRDALFTAGNTLELDCTISGFPPNVTSDMIYFRPERPAELGGQRVDVIDHATSRLSFPGVQRAENLGHVFCYVSQFDDEYDHVSFRVAGIDRLITSTRRPAGACVRYLGVIAVIAPITGGNTACRSGLKGCLHYDTCTPYMYVVQVYGVHVS